MIESSSQNEHLNLKARGVCLKRLLDNLATGFQVGRLGYAPGTLGTILAIPLAWLLSLTGPIPYIAGSLLVTMGAVFVAEWYEFQVQTHDNKEVVIDEVAGFIITMALIPITWLTVFAGFALFRFFDILKPYPISYFDRKIPGGLGVVADDIAAGVAANIVLQILYTNTNWLGVSL
jgi:phosphatidylglycerophosphatase A